MTESPHETNSESDPDKAAHTRQGGGGTPIPADDPRDESLQGEDAGTKAEKATPPTEGPAAAGALPG
jgi:hypothetical protein